MKMILTPERSGKCVCGIVVDNCIIYKAVCLLLCHNVPVIKELC
jgi:hypothetical protein